MSDNAADLATYLQELARLSRNGEVAWGKVSPAVYVSERETPAGRKRMSIQRAQDPPYMDPFDVKTAYLFRVSSPKGGVELTLNSREDEGLWQPLDELFASASVSQQRYAEKVLRDLVGVP